MITKHTILAKYKALSPLVQHLSHLVSEFISIQTKYDSYHAIFDIDDTLIFDDNRQTPNVQIKYLLDVSRAHGCKIHLITARENTNEVTKWTRDELRRHSIQYDTLALCPKKFRNTMTSVAAWKHSERLKHASEKSIPIFSIGDQFGDSTLIQSDDDIDVLDKQFGTSETPWIIFQTSLGVPVYSVKIMAPT
jgi:hypothetical protein